MKGAIKYFVIWLLMTVLAIAAFYVIAMFVTRIAGIKIDDPVGNHWLFSGALLAADVVVLLLFWKRRYTRKWINYGYTYGEGFSSRKLALWCVLGAFGCLMLDVMAQEYVPIPVDPDLNEFFEMLFSNPVGILSVCLIGPLAEEAVFRGAIERRLLEKNWNPWFAIVISAILFAAAHGNYEQGVTAVIIGCFMGWVYYRTRSIWPTFLIHAFNNTTAVVAAYSIPESMIDVNADTMGIPLSWGIPLILVSLILIYIAARYIGRMTNDRTPILEPVPVGEVLPPPFSNETPASDVHTGYPMGEVPVGTTIDEIPTGTLLGYTDGVSHFAEPEDDLPSDFNPQDS